MLMALPLSASFIIIFSFSCIFFKACFCFCESFFFCVVFSFRLILHNFLKNVFSSLLLLLSGKNLILFLLESHLYVFYFFIFLLV